MKKIIFTLCIALVSSFTLFAQDAIIKGRVVDTHSSEVISEIEVRILSTNFNTETNSEGLFNLTGTDFPQGEQILVVSKLNYITQSIPITIQNGETINLDPIIMEIDLTELESQIGVISLSDGELDGDLGGAATNVSGLLQASRDVFLRAAAFDFSSTFFRPRGLDNAYGKVLINGIEMNKQFNGRPQWGDWGGLNDVQRNREFTMGMKANDYAFGDLAGTTNIIMRASKNRRNGRVSFAAANRSYKGRIMASYSSGVSKTGWAYSFLAARRFGNEGYIDGTLYDANSFYASVEKKINDAHSINFTGFYTPNRRGRSTAITQEVKDLKGIRYNPNWGYQDGEKRNSRVRQIKEPVFMLNHYWDINEKTTLNTNVGYQTGKIGNSRIDSGNNQNPSGNYYQKLPSYLLRDENPTPYDYQQAYLAQQEFINDGQLDWASLYRGNANSSTGNAAYIVQEDRVDDSQFSINSILNTRFSDNILFDAAVNYRSLNGEYFASVVDLLGADGFLDVDYFGDNTPNNLQNPVNFAKEGDRYKYNYELNASVISGFAQAQFKYALVDFYIAANFGQTSYQRSGLYENGYFPGERSFGDSEKADFTTYGVKGGATYKITGRHLIDLNAGYFTKAPTMRNTFANARQNNDIVEGITEEKVQSIDLSYIYRSPIVKARLTGYYTGFQDATDIGFYFTQNALGTDDNNAFVQEIVTGIEKRNVGLELGIEAQVLPTLKLKAAASVGQYIYNNNPSLYLSSDDFGIDGNDIATLGFREVTLKNYRVSGGPERAYQLGLEYRNPHFWWVGVTTNYFSNAYLDISNLRRTSDFYTDIDGQPFNDYDEEVARGLLKQEKLDDYFLVNLTGGKSWKIKDYYVGVFASINNVLDQEFITGGFEDSRRANYRQQVEEQNRDNGPIFGNRYFFGTGSNYYVNVYVRF
jgi:hypothetical protein